MYVQCSIEVRSRNQCYRGKQIGIKHTEFVTVALVKTLYCYSTLMHTIIKS